MRIRVAIPDEHVSPEVIDPVLEAVTRVNESMMRNGQTPTASELVRGGAVWRPENMGDEHFDHGATIASRGWGDCDDWAPLKAAEMRLTGEDPGAVARVVPSGPSTYHAMVQRSDGRMMSGDDDISVQAGMHPIAGTSVVGGDPMAVYACDPHDGRIYQGSLLPTTGPLTIHCGPGLAIRGCHVVGHGRLYEARVDMPIVGSPLVAVRSYARHRGHRHRIHGHLPYAIACTHMAGTPAAALKGALEGAILCGDAAEMNTSLDRYKLLALQAATAGMSAGETREALKNAIAHDMAAAAQQSGRSPEEHVAELYHQIPAAHVVGGFFDAIGHIASSVVSDVSHVANAVVKAAGAVPWGDIVHGVQAAISAVPGIGTAVSDIVATAETAYESAAALLHGNPLEAAIDAAYNYALASIPGAASFHGVLDPIKNTLINLTVKKQPIESAVLDGLLSGVPDTPAIGPLTPRSIAASLAHLIVSHLGVKKTPGHVPTSKPSAVVHPAAVKTAPHTPPKPTVHPLAVSLPNLHLAKPIAIHPMAASTVHPSAAARPPPPAHAALALKPLGVAHAATPATPAIPAHPSAAPAPTLAPSRAPGSPGTTWHCQPLPGGHWACAWQ
jgi:hypothetical protein